MKPTRSEQDVFVYQCLGALFVMLSLSVGTAQGQTVGRQIATVDLPGATILAMNNSGDVTGYYCEQESQSCYPYSSNSRGFLRESNGTITTFEGTPRAINDAGTVAGYLLETGTQVFVGFLRNKRGVVTTFHAVTPLQNDCGTYFMAMNNREEIAGYYIPCPGVGVYHTIVVMRAKNRLITKFEVPIDMIPTAINGAWGSHSIFSGRPTA